MTDVMQRAKPPRLLHAHGWRLLLLLALALVAVTLLSLASGFRPIGPHVVLSALSSFDPNNFDHQVLVRFRLPRILAAILVGAALALTGALLQSLVRNPLAEPQLLGLNAGAALAVVAVSVVGIKLPELSRPMIAGAGALLAFTLVLGLSGIGRTGPTPLKVTLCGIVVSGFASAVTSALLLIDEQAIDELRLWLSGDLGGQTYHSLLIAAPFIGAATLLALFLSPRIALLSLGDTVAKGLGVNVAVTRVLALLVAAVLSGSAVALGGQIGFIGLIVPHLMRRLTGDDMRLQFVACLLAGPLLLIVADMLARQLFSPIEISTGVVTGTFGALVFIYLVARYFK
jgi:iron complex transport system permease protein